MAPKTSKQFEAIRKESKQKIMFAALELFAIDGYHNTSVSQIAKHAGVSKGLMYNYFENKEGLLKDVVTMSLSDAEEVGEDMMVFLKTVSPGEAICFVIEKFFEMLQENTLLWKFTLSLSMQVANMPLIKQTIEEKFVGLLRQIEFVLTNAGYKNAIVESRLLMAQLDGIAFHYLLFEKDYDLKNVKEELKKKYI